MSQALVNRHCVPCHRDTVPYDATKTSELLAPLHGWRYIDNAIECEFHFPDYYRTMAFVNAVAWLAHQEDHHPQLTVFYQRCIVRYHTHSIGGVSDNDLICAAKINMLIESKP
ncbi:MAG: 4a-hydroxytetrahydrobiopterin dehydratase [Gammaproteobacteria bacterium]|nr:4a-hydroxytetrahydrobiopterin dehydratase [Gammaproteobacteria bacterium]MDH5652185.1 4a-hydroxytetrahydrobiopterin dehydratase [Gammaproteobacteria bacterium]